MHAPGRQDELIDQNGAVVPPCQNDLALLALRTDPKQNDWSDQHNKKRPVILCR